MPESSQNAKDRVAARGYQFRLILATPVPADKVDLFNEGWREKWGNNAHTPNLSLNGKNLFGSFSTQPVQDLLEAGYASDDDYRAVSKAVSDEHKIMKDLF